MTERPWGMIKDPIYGYVHISDLERELIDTLPLQRLRRIKQLVFADYVYPGANHTRFEHSIGVMHLAGLLGGSLPIGMGKEDLQKVRAAGLLHDIGHGPFSHTFEQILVKKLGKTHEDMTQWLVRETELKDILNAHGLDAEDIAKLAVGRSEKSKTFMNQIISGSVDVDKMDFLMRDTHHTGAEYGKVDVYRLIYTMEVAQDNLVVDSSALPTLEAFLIARLESFRAIYYHRTARAGQILLVRALEAADKEEGVCSFNSPEEYLEMDDFTLWSDLKRCKESRQIILDLESRKLLKCVYEREVQAEDKAVSSLFEMEGIRKQVEEEIAALAGVPANEIFIDIPSLPSIPYRHTMNFDPMEIPIFDSGAASDRILRATKLSKTIEVLRGFMNIVRLYTHQKNRERVKEAAERVLGSLPDSAKISF